MNEGRFGRLHERPALVEEEARAERLQLAEHSPGQREESANQLEDAADRDAQQPERQQNEPDQRIKNHRKQRQRPAQNKQDAKQQQLQHASFLFPAAANRQTALS